MRAGLDDLPKRWRALLSLPDQALASETVAEPERSPRDVAEELRPHEQRLPDKLILLEREFLGQPKACLAHAALIVLIRRDIALPATLQHYFALWQAHEALLLERLSLRWLVSAADTLVDHGRDPAEKATAFATVLFANTLKLYETERVFSLATPPDEGAMAGEVPRFNLGGIAVFRVARGDTVGNMFQRKDSLLPELGLAGKILDRAMTRANALDTVYARFRKFHKGRYGW